MNPISRTIYFFKDGFFGYGESGNFKNFTIQHFAPIVLTILVILLIYKFREKLRGGVNTNREENIRYAFGFIMLLCEMSYFWRILYIGPGFFESDKSLMSYLPLQVCEWTLFACFFMLLKKSENLFQIGFTISLSLGLLPLIIPETTISHMGPAYYRYYQYWGEHLLPIISIFYMIIVYDFKPDLKKGLLFSAAELTVLYLFSIPANNTIALLGEKKWYMYVYYLDGISFLDTVKCKELIIYLILLAAFLVIALIPHGVYALVMRIRMKSHKESQTC